MRSRQFVKKMNVSMISIPIYRSCNRVCFQFFIALISLWLLREVQLHYLFLNEL